MGSTSLIFPNEPPEDSDTRDIGYGHKITKAEEKSGKVYGIDISKGITESQATQILKKDKSDHEAKAKKLMGSHWDKLNQSGRDMITDYSFTGVLNKFPKMIEAIKKRDVGGVLKEYKRKYTKDGELVTLGRRNELGIQLALDMMQDW